jgi:hypothetical protein
MKYLLYILVSVLNADKIIKNINIPACRNCIHYKPVTYNSDFTTPYNKCTKFGDKDIVTDKITYNFAESCRNDESKCGLEGKYFIEEPNINMKVLKHTVLSSFSLPNIFLISYLFLIILITINK